VLNGCGNKVQDNLRESTSYIAPVPEMLNSEEKPEIEFQILEKKSEPLTEESLVATKNLIDDMRLSDNF